MTNDLSAVATECRRLMIAHGVGRLPFEFGRTKRSIARCWHARIDGTYLATRIELSEHFAKVLTMDEIREAMLHEIAHALTPGHGHDDVWKAEAIRLGVPPVTHTKTTASPKSAWEGTCNSCGKVQGQQHRAPLRVYLCGSKECKPLPYHDRHLVWSKNGIRQFPHEMPVRWQSEYREVVRLSEKKVIA